MLEQINATLAEVCRGYGDTRTQFCQLSATMLDWGRCALTGAVLDEKLLDAVLADLTARLPGLSFDVSTVAALRRAEPLWLSVTTHLTGLYAQPSFLAEKLSEVLNGWRLEILREQDRWCLVRQEDGYLGWVYRPYLGADVAPAATHIVCEPISLLHSEPAAAAPLASRILGGTAVAVTASQAGWVRLALAGGLTGWTPLADLRVLAALSADEAGQRGQIVADAARWTGVPYLWGGCTAFGIDCSGLAQLMHRLSGVTLPRDADMQYDAGRPVEFPYQPGDLLFFGEGDRRRITHVAISLGGWRIRHASRSRNGVFEDDVQAVAHLRESFVGARTYLLNNLGATRAGLRPCPSWLGQETGHSSAAPEN